MADEGFARPSAMENWERAGAEERAGEAPEENSGDWKRWTRPAEERRRAPKAKQGARRRGVSRRSDHGWNQGEGAVEQGPSWAAVAMASKKQGVGRRARLEKKLERAQGKE